MPTDGYKQVSLRDDASAELKGMRETLQAAGTGALPPELATHAGSLTLSDIVMLGMKALRSRIRPKGAPAR